MPRTVIVFGKLSQTFAKETRLAKIHEILEHKNKQVPLHSRGCIFENKISHITQVLPQV